MASLLPLIIMTLLWVVKSLLRCKDQGKCLFKFRPQKTKKRTIQSFVFLYGGSNFMIFNHIAQMVVLVWVAFLFAPGIPILFPMALFGITLLYYTNRA